MHLYLGTYSQPLEAGMGAKGDGIYRCDLDPETSALGTAELAAPCINPSYLTFCAARRTLYAVQEVFTDAAPAVHSFVVGQDGSLAPQSTQPVPGELPCHLALDPSRKWLATAQYWTGDVALYPIAGDGSVEALAVTFTHSGSGPDTARQEGPHAHCVVFSDGGRMLHVTDLGTDQVRTFDLSPRSGAISTAPSAVCAMPAGCGPRHLVVTADERTAFVANELDETVVVLKRMGPGWEVVQVVPAFDIDPGTEGSLAAIRLSPDERHVYVSGRRQSQIACFAVEAADRSLSPVGRFAAAGGTPRDFTLTSDGRWVVAASETDNRLACIPRDAGTGALGPASGGIEVGTPVAILEVAA